MPYSSPSSSHYQAHYRVSRLARRGGIKRMSAAIYPEMRLVLKQRLETVRIPPISDAEESFSKGECEWARTNLYATNQIIKNLVLVLESSATPSHERKVSLFFFSLKLTNSNERLTTITTRRPSRPPTYVEPRYKKLLRHLFSLQNCD
jgi:hypothetical protein